MNSISQLAKRLDKITGEKKPSEYYVLKFDHSDGEPPEILRVWQMRQREFVRDISPDEFPGIVTDRDTLINFIESDSCSV